MKKVIILSAVVAVSAASQATPIFATGFEAADGFTVGPINSQSGWSTFSDPTVISAPIISTANPNGGSQHLRLPDSSTATDGTLSGGFSPLFSSGASTVVSSSIDVYIPSGDAFGANYTFAAQSPSQGLLTFRVEFDWQGDILVLDDPGTGFALVDTGTAITYDSYQTIEVISDWTAGTQTYKYGGNTIYTGSTAGLGTNIEQVVLFSDSFQNVGVAGGDMDNLDVHSVDSVPEPASLLAMGAGLVALGIRRRRK